MNTKKLLIENAVKKLAGVAVSASDRIAQLAEPPFQEHQSANLIAGFLSEHGFDVEFRYKNIPTAFRAVWGRGRPCLGVLGEYDALPDCGAKPGTWGHGCGHNLLGVGAATGAIAAADILRRRRLPGRIVYYGCPAEELLAGKAYMARDGAFAELDACMAWHPSDRAGVRYHGGAAIDSVTYEFFGKTGHAASPVGSKSALDAAIIFDVAVNYLRESLPENMRVHSVILHGGDAPNVVPAYARSWYYIRGRDRAQVDKTRKQVDDCARGAAIATQTRFKVRRISAIYNRLPNDGMYEVVRDNLNWHGASEGDKCRPAFRALLGAGRCS